MRPSSVSFKTFTLVQLQQAAISHHIFKGSVPLRPHQLPAKGRAARRQYQPTSGHICITTGP